MSSKYVKKYKIPIGFRDLLTEFTREILRNQPNDLVNLVQNILNVQNKD